MESGKACDSGGGSRSLSYGKKIGSLLGNVVDTMLMNSGGFESRHIKILVEVDLSKPLARGTILKCRGKENWIIFKYGQLPGFCYYCGCIGHSDRLCSVRKDDLKCNRLKENQYGNWLRAANNKMGIDKH